MKLIGWEEFLQGSDDPRPLATTIGAFDGIHLGHRALIEKVVGTAPGYRNSVLTFAENPKRTLHPRSFHGELMPLGKKIRTLESLGVELCVLIDFSANFSTLPGRVFLGLLGSRAHVRYVVVGSDFKCGRDLDTETASLAAIGRESGIVVDIEQPVEWNGRAISSSRIRRAVLEGRMDDASCMLGRPYEVEVRIAVPPEGRIDFPAPLVPFLPPPGSYHVRLMGVDPEHGGVLEIDPAVWHLDTRGPADCDSIGFIEKAV